MSDDSSYSYDFTGWSPAGSQGGDSSTFPTAGFQDWGGADYLAGTPVQESGGGVSTGFGSTPATVGSGMRGTAYSTTPDTTGKQTGGGTSGGRSGGGGTSYGTIQRTSYLGGKALPTMTVPTYATPLYDYNRINFLTGQQAAPGYSKLQNALYTGMGKIAATDNPYMQGQARKSLLQGYGGGISEVAAGAARTGAQLYAPEYAGKVTEAQTNYQGQMTVAQNMFQAALQDWMKSLTTETTNTPYMGGNQILTKGATLSGGYAEQPTMIPFDLTRG